MAAPAHYERIKEICRDIYKDTKLLSWHAIHHPLYKELVAMGKEVVPALLRRIEEFKNGDEMSVWEPICALQEITGGPSIPKEDHGRLDALLRHWLAWGEEEGLKWRD